MFTIPFRRSASASLSDAIRTYIDACYGQHPDMFRTDLEAIDALRYSAIHVQEPHISGVRKLLAYAGQLVWIGGKFPIDIGTDFTWWPAFGYDTKRPLSRNNLKYELLNVLWNLAALLSQMAEGSPRSTTDGLKVAASYLAQAAGVLDHMKAEILPNLRMIDPPDDMDEHTLEALAKLCLAQCQECFWQRAVMDGYKDAVISRLAARVSDLYIEARDAAVQSKSISSMWIHVMGAKHHHFAAAAQCRTAMDCLEKKKFGEEIARLKDALKCVGEGLREMKGVRGGQAIVTDLTNFKKQLEDDIKRGEKDNDLIYLNPVPAKSDLAILERANMAVAKAPPELLSPIEHMGEEETATLGPLLFTKLVPYEVHRAVAIYEERRDRLVSSDIVEKIEDLNAKMRNLLRDLNIPGSLQALERPLGVPTTTNHHAEEMRQAEAVVSMERSLRELENLRADNLRQFEQGKSLLQTERNEDARLLEKYGTNRWSRPNGPEDPAGKELYEKASEIEAYFAQSADSDALVRSTFDQNFEMFSLLCGPQRDLLNYIPSSRTVDLPESLRTAIGQLRRYYNDAQRLESRRRKKLESVQDVRRRDDIKPEMLREAGRLQRTRPNVEVTAADFEDFLNRRLDKTYDEILDSIDQDAIEQDKILGEVQLANREFEAQVRRMGTSAGGEARRDAIQRLENAFGAYKQIQYHLGVARTFYNDLLKVTGSGFVARIEKWVDGRRAAARELEEEINLPVLSHLSLGQQSQSQYQQPQQTYQQSQQPQSQPQPQYQQPQQTQQAYQQPQQSQPQYQQPQQSQPQYQQAHQQVYQQPQPQTYQQPPAQPQPQPQPQAYQPQPQTYQPQPTTYQQPHQPQPHPPQAPIQSWATQLHNPQPSLQQGAQFPSVPSGPGPNPASGIWQPGMEIRFAAPAGRQ